MKSYKAEELFDKNGRLIPELEELAPKGDRRMGSNPHANGGLLLRDLRMPDFHDHAVKVPSPGGVAGQDTLVLGKFLRDVVKLNEHNFRVFGPDETLSNLLGAVFETTNRQWEAQEVKTDEFLAPAGRVLDSMLSEHQCEGWLEGYLLTGRHGLFNSYEAFIRIVDSMFSQHAKWLKVTAELPWRRKIASLNYLLASHVWQQDHNGFTHQAPGFLDHVINKKADIVRVYLPPDANCLLSVFDHCLRSRHYPRTPTLKSLALDAFGKVRAERLDALLPVAVVTGGVENGGYNDDMLGFTHFINHAVGKPVGITPADVLTRMTTGIKQRIRLQRIENLNHLFTKFSTQTCLLRIIPDCGLGHVMFDFGTNHHAPVHDRERSRRFISSNGADEAGF